MLFEDRALFKVNCNRFPFAGGGGDEYKARERTCGEIKPTLVDTTLTPC